jgi:hypothetical protein
MNGEILGTRCYTCVKLETLIDEGAGQLGVNNFVIERLRDQKRILQHMPFDEIPGIIHGWKTKA